MNRCAKLLFTVIALLAVVIDSTADKNWIVSRTEYGQPDLQGVWFYGTSTPYERPEALDSRQSHTEEEARQLVEILLNADLKKMQPLTADRSAPEAGMSVAQEADHNFATSRTNLINIDGLYRTSQVINPTNGRLPYREEGKDIFQMWLAQGHGAFDGPEIRPASERCVGPNGGPMAPMIGWFYNANMQIVQTKDYFMLLAEMNNDARIIPITNDQYEGAFPQWMGHSVGRWDGDTLVVETTGFRPEQSWFAFLMSDQLRVIERFKLIAADEILYTYTFYDSTIYTEPVTVEKNIVRRATGEHIYEYACHEGNYSTPGILAGARRQEL